MTFRIWSYFIEFLSQKKQFRLSFRQLRKQISILFEYYIFLENCNMSWIILISYFQVRDGYRLDKPEHCRRELYNIMYYCWDKDSKQRPNFSECVALLEKLLLTETDYIELERFPDHSYYNMVSLSGEKLWMKLIKCI